MREPALRVAVVTSPILLVLTVLFVERSGSEPYYGVARLAEAVSAVAIVAPVCAALAAWEGARLRRGGVARLAPARREAAIAARCLWPIAALGALALGVAVAQALWGASGLRARDLLLVAVPVAVLTGWIAVGYVLGRSRASFFAAPLALVGSWLWLVYPAAIEPLWIRHLTGYMTGCCDVASVPAGGAIAAPVVIGIGLALAAVALLARRSWWVRASAAAAIGLAALLVAVPLVQGLDAEPEAARPGDELRCSQGTPTVCLWPEHDAVAALVAEEATAMRARLLDAGVATPPTVTEARVPLSADAWPIGVSPTSGREQVSAVLVQGLLPGPPACAESSSYPAYEAYWPLAVWLAEHAGVGPLFEREATAAERREVDAADGLPRDEQLQWFRANLAALERCDVPPTLLTSR